MENTVFVEIKKLNDEVERLRNQSQDLRLKYQRKEGINYDDFSNRYYNYFLNKKE